MCPFFNKFVSVLYFTIPFFSICSFRDLFPQGIICLVLFHASYFQCPLTYDLNIAITRFVVTCTISNLSLARWEVTLLTKRVFTYYYFNQTDVKASLVGIRFWTHGLLRGMKVMGSAITGWIPLCSVRSRQHAWRSCRVGCIANSENSYRQENAAGYLSNSCLKLKSWYN